MKLQATEFSEILKQVFSWLPKSYSESEVANILANLMLNPQVTPTNEISLDVYQALLRVDLAAEKKTLGRQRLVAPVLRIPEKIIQNCRNLAEALMIFLDGIQPTGIFDLEITDFKVVTCFCFEGQLNPKNIHGKVAEVRVDFGIEKKQKLDIAADQIVRIPLRVGFVAEVAISTFGQFKIAGQKKLSQKVTGSEVGLIFDARGRPIIAPGETDDRPQRASAWRKDLQTP